MVGQSGNPIPPLPQFVEGSKLANSHESTSLALQWQNNRDYARLNHSMQAWIRQVNTALGYIQAQRYAPYLFHPFKVYFVPQQFCPAKQDGYDPATDYPLTFRVRIGDVGTRPKFVAIDSGGTSGDYPKYPVKNYEAVFSVQTGSDGNDVTGVYPNDNWADYQQENYSIDQDDVASGAVDAITNVPVDGTETDVTYNNATTFVLPNQSTSMNDSQVTGLDCAVYIKITDIDITDTPAVEIKCRLYNSESFDGGGIGHQAFPDSDFFGGITIIPIALISFHSLSGDYGSKLQLASGSISQLIYDHAVNRSYPAWRGSWDVQNLSGQYFYTGDIITADPPDTAPPNSENLNLLSVDDDYTTYQSPGTAFVYMSYGQETDLPYNNVYGFGGQWQPLSWQIYQVST